jgi:hypothetical protein
LITSNNKPLKLFGDLFGVPVPRLTFRRKIGLGAKMAQAQSSPLKRKALKHERGGRVNASAP